MPEYSSRFGLPLGNHIGGRGTGVIKTIDAGVFQSVEDKMIEGLVTVLSSRVIDANAVQLNPFFIPPIDKKVIITEVLIHSNTATLAGMTDVDFGGGTLSNVPVWLDAVDLSSMTTAESILKLAPTVPVVIIDGADGNPAAFFTCTVNTGSSGAADVTVDVLGYLIDS